MQYITRKETINDDVNDDDADDSNYLPTWTFNMYPQYQRGSVLTYMPATRIETESTGAGAAR